MRFLERLQLGLNSQLGAVVLGLVLILVLLFAIYWVLVVRQRRRDYYAYLHREYYRQAEALVTQGTFLGAHKAEFFGRQTVVKMHDGTYGLCLIPPPELADSTTTPRFVAYTNAIKLKPPALLAPVISSSDKEPLVIVQGQLLGRDGRPLLSARHYLTDRRLVVAERETLLLRLARTLADLHDLHSDAGERLYHGFLLPRSLLMDLDARHQLAHCAIADAGWAMSLGPKRLFERMTLLRQGKLPIERVYANDLLEQMSCLAPEQRDAGQLSQVGCCSDFFAFGALAVSLFTERRFVSPSDVIWDHIPNKWRPFLRSCLEHRPSSRPKDFLDLQEWLSDPEFALFHAESVSPAPVGVSASQAVSDDLRFLTELLRHQDIDRASGHNDPRGHLEAGVKAIRSAKWEAAKKSLKQAVRLDESNVEAHVNLAIALYELGDLKNAEKHFETAKSLNPQAAKKFRQHIAFRV